MSSRAPKPPATTVDGLFHGALKVAQSRGGYRFTEDALFLASFAARSGLAELALDLGAGCGVMGLTLLHHGVAERLIAAELQGSLAAFALANTLLNAFDGRALVTRSDFRRLPLADGTVDLLVSNPPYLPVGRGLLPRHRERALARHELFSSPESLLVEAARCLSPSGRIAVIYPEARFDQVSSALFTVGLGPTRIRRVLPAPGAPPGLVMVEARHRAAVVGKPTVEEPLIARDQLGQRGEEVERLFSGRWGMDRRV